MAHADTEPHQKTVGGIEWYAESDGTWSASLEDKPGLVGALALESYEVDTEDYDVPFYFPTS